MPPSTSTLRYHLTGVLSVYNAERKSDVQAHVSGVHIVHEPNRPLATGDEVCAVWVILFCQFHPCALRVLLMDTLYASLLMKFICFPPLFFGVIYITLKVEKVKGLLKTNTINSGILLSIHMKHLAFAIW